MGSPVKQSYDTKCAELQDPLCALKGADMVNIFLAMLLLFIYLLNTCGYTYCAILLGIPAASFTFIWAISPYVRQTDTVPHIIRALRTFRYTGDAQRQGLEALLFQLNKDESPLQAALKSTYDHGGVEACLCALDTFPQDTELQHLAFAVLFKLASLASVEEALQRIRKPDLRELCLARAREHIDCAECVKGAVLLYARLTESQSASEAHPQFLSTLKMILLRYAKLGQQSEVHLQVVIYTCATLFSYMETLQQLRQAELQLLPLVLDAAIANPGVEQLQVVVFGTLYKVAHLYDKLEEGACRPNANIKAIQATYQEAERRARKLSDNATLVGLIKLIHQTKLFK